MRPLCSRCGKVHVPHGDDLCGTCADIDAPGSPPAEASETTPCQDWTPEPWSEWDTFACDKSGEVVATFEHYGDTARACACVNALQGIPAADLPALRDRLERLTLAAEAALRWSRGRWLSEFPSDLLRAALDTKGPSQ